MSKPTPDIEGRGVASIVGNLSYLLGGRAVYFAVRFLYAVVLARLLGPQIYGMINYGIVWYLLFLPLTRMGVEVVLSRDAGRNRQEGNQTAACTLTLQLASIIAVTAVYLTLSWLIESDPTFRLMVFVFTFALIGRSLTQWTESVYTAYEVNQYSFRQESFFRPLEVALGLLVIILWRDALWVVVIHGLVWCTQAIYGFTIVHRRIFALRLDKNILELRRVFMQCFPLGIALLLMAFPYQGPLIFFRHLSHHEELLGQFALAMQVFFMLSHIPYALGNVSLPVLSRVQARNDGKDRIFVETVLRFSLLFGTCLALLGTALGPWLTLQIFGIRYTQAGFLIGPVLWLMIPWSVSHAFVRVLIARRQDRQVMFSALIGAVLFSMITLGLVLRYQTIGAILSAGVGMVLTTLLLMFYLLSQMDMDLRSSLIKPGLTAISSVVVFYVLHTAGPMWSLLGAYVVMAFGCYLLSCMTPQDKLWLRNFSRFVARRCHL